MHKYTYKFIPSWPRVLHKDVSTLSDHIHSWFQVTRHQARSMSMAKNILKNLTLCHQKHRVLYAQTPIPEILKYEFPRNFPTTIPNSSEKCPPKHWFLGENHHVFLLKVQLYAFGRNLELAFFAKSGRFAAFFWNPHFLISAWWAQWVLSYVHHLPYLGRCILRGRQSVWRASCFASGNHGTPVTCQLLRFRRHSRVARTATAFCVHVCLQQFHCVFCVSRFVRVLWLSSQEQYFRTVARLWIWIKNRLLLRRHRCAIQFSTIQCFDLVLLVTSLRFCCDMVSQ